MIKLMCGFVIVMGCGYIGITMASRLDKEVEQTDRFISALRFLESEISMNGRVLSEAAAGVSRLWDGVVADIFGQAARELEELRGEKVGEVWSRAVEQNRERLCLSESSMTIVKDFAALLGSGTRELERDNINAACDKLKIARDEAAAKAKKNGAVYRSLGFACGILITVLLL